MRRMMTVYVNAEHSDEAFAILADAFDRIEREHPECEIDHDVEWEDVEDEG